nr:reverse transcriptase domain-containing protein [Tanacetum cinerariifolium]
MRTRSRSRHKIVEPLRIEFHSQEDQFQEDPPVATMTDNHTMAEMLRAPTEGLRNEISNFEQKFGESFHEAWDRYKDLLRACPHHGFTELHQLNTFYNALNPTDQDSLNAAAGGNLLERSTQDVLTIIENKSKVHNSQSKSIASQVKACDTNSSSEMAKLTHAVNEQTSDVTTAMTAMLRQFQATPPPAPVKAVEETCVTCGGAARRWLKKEPPCSIHTWEDLAWDRYKDLLRACPHHGFTKLHQLDTFYNALNPVNQDSLNAVAGGNLLERRTQDVLTIIKNKSKVRINQQTSVVTTAMTTILKQIQATPPPASVKAVEKICVTCGGAHPYYQCLATGGNTFP